MAREGSERREVGAQLVDVDGAGGSLVLNCEGQIEQVGVG